MAQLLRVETKPCLSLGPESGPKNPKIISEFEKLATGDNQTYIGCGKKDDFCSLPQVNKIFTPGTSRRWKLQGSVSAGRQVLHFLDLFIVGRKVLHFFRSSYFFIITWWHYRCHCPLNRDKVC